jgi:hypothetical protein
MHAPGHLRDAFEVALGGYLYGNGSGLDGFFSLTPPHNVSGTIWAMMGAFAGSRASYGTARILCRAGFVAR